MCGSNCLCPATVLAVLVGCHCCFPVCRFFLTPPVLGGLRLGQLDGTWITGSGDGVPPTGDLGGGLTLGQLDGTWIGSHRRPSGGFTLNRLMGVWVDAAPTSTFVSKFPTPLEEKSVSGTLRTAKAQKAKLARPILQLNQPLKEDKIDYAMLHREDEEIISAVATLIQLGIIR